MKTIIFCEIDLYKSVYGGMEYWRRRRR